MIVTLFESTTKSWVYNMDYVVDTTWDDFVEILLTKQNGQTKEDGTLFNLAEFKKIGDETALLGRTKIYDKNREWNGEYYYHENTVRRCKDNLVSISGIMLDFDKDCRIETSTEPYDGIEYVLYTTFNHTIDSHRFRIVIPFTTPLLVDDIPRKMESIKQTFPGVDNASFSASQSFYFHSGHNDPLAYHNKGYMIDPYNDFVDGVVQPKQHYDSTRYNDGNYQISEEYRQTVLASLYTMRGIRYPNALTLVACCKSIGLSFNEFSNLCKHVADSDSTLIKNPYCHKDLWHSNYERITNEKRNKFIMEHNGSPPTRVLSPQQAIRQLNRKITIY